MAGCSLLIINREKHETDYKAMFPVCVSDAFFGPSGAYLFAVIRGVDPGVFRFRITDGNWSFVNELEIVPNQSVINPQLRHVFLTTQEIIFIYNTM